MTTTNEPVGVCCVCGTNLLVDDEYETITTDHGPDYCCCDCEYDGD